jgi:hypothetical protein
MVVATNPIKLFGISYTNFGVNPFILPKVTLIFAQILPKEVP